MNYSAIIEQLLNDPTKQLTDYLEVLQAHQLVDYLTFKQFQNKIKLTQSPYASQFLKATNSRKAKKIIPWIKSQDQNYQRTKLRLFLHSYHLNKETFLDQHHFGENFQFPNPQSQNNEKQESVMNKGSEFFIPAQISRSQELNEKPNLEDMPSQILRTTEWNGWLFSINVTYYFRNQLAEVVNMIKQQMKNGSLLPIYQQFLMDYRYFKQLTNIQLEDEHTDEAIGKLKKYQETYLNTVDRSQKYSPYLIQLWEKIKNKYDTTLKKRIQSECSQEKIQETLQKGLDSIQLIFHPCRSIQGTTFDNKICINVNQNHQNKPLVIYKQMLLKPFIALCIYHELGHYLLRLIAQVNLNQLDKSFHTNQNTIAPVIFNLIYNNKSTAINKLKGALNMKSIVNEESFFKPQKIKSIIGKINQKNLFEKCQHLNRLLQQKEVLFSETQSELLMLSKMLQTIRGKLSNDWFQLHFSSIKDYIIKLNEINWQEYIQNEDFENKSIRYKFFFSIYRLESFMKQFIPQNCMNSWMQSVNTIPIKAKTYFIEENEAINEILSQFTASNTFYFSDMKQFADIFLSEKNKQREIFDNINTLLGLVKSQDISTYTNLIYKRVQLSFNHQTVLTIFNDSFDQHVAKLNQKDQDTLQEFKTLLNIRQDQILLKELYKWADIVIIDHDLPVFYSTSINPQHRFESGYDIQRRLFPKLDETSKIYSKDYELIAQLQNIMKRRNVGVQPTSQEAKHFFVPLRQKSQKQGLFIDLSQGSCGNAIMKGDLNRKLKKLTLN